MCDANQTLYWWQPYLAVEIEAIERVQAHLYADIFGLYILQHKTIRELQMNSTKCLLTNAKLTEV